MPIIEQIANSWAFRVNDDPNIASISLCRGNLFDPGMLEIKFRLQPTGAKWGPLDPETQLSTKEPPYPSPEWGEGFMTALRKLEPPVGFSLEGTILTIANHTRLADVLAIIPGWTKEDYKPILDLYMSYDSSTIEAAFRKACSLVQDFPPGQVEEVYKHALELAAKNRAASTDAGLV